MTKKFPAFKKPNIPIAVEREAARLTNRVAELEAACKLAHDTLADVAGALGPSWATVDIDKAFRELVRVLYIDNGPPPSPRPEVPPSA